MKINTIALPLCLALFIGAWDGAARAASENEPVAAERLDGPAQSEERSPSRSVPHVASRAAKDMSYSELVDELEAGNVRAVTITGQEVTARLQNGTIGRSYVPDEAEFVQQLQDHDVTITAKPSGSQGGLSALLVWIFPLLLLFGLWYFIMRQTRRGGGAGSQVMDFKRSKAKLLDRTQGRTTFKDVAGIEEAKDDLEEIVDFLRDPLKFRRLGGRIPSGVLLVGAPGTGKTLVARAVAGEADVAFFSISGSDFVEMFVGVGASRVRDMFDQAKTSAPCIVFIDEIDALGRRRGAGVGGGNDEREQTLNQLLVEMDGFESSAGVIVIAATNRPDVLDPALLRPGRFDRQVVVHKPDLAGRAQILRVHTRKVPLGADVDLKTVARGTPGFSGAELANLVNEAALLAARRSKARVGMAEFEDAKDKLIMGAERGTLVMSEEERRLAAYHEAGHALVALHMPASDPIHKATIIPRGQSLGMVARLPEGDRMALTRAKCRADLAVAMGGRVAEELVFGADTATSSASADIRMATDLSRAMVTRFGMSQRLGPLTYGEDDEEVFVGRSVTRQQHVSDQTQKLVDEEIKAFVHYGYETARQILSARLDELHRLAEGLLENETLSGAEIRAMAAGEAPALARSNDGGPGDADSAVGV